MREASCCSVEVMNGGAGRRRRWLRSTALTGCLGRVLKAEDLGLFPIEGVHHLPARVLQKSCSEDRRWLARGSLDGPVLLAAERLDCFLAFHQQAQRRTLDPAGRQFRADLAPQQWRQLEADQMVHCPSRTVGIDEIHRHLTGLLNGLPHLPFGDFVEHDPIDLAILEQAPLTENFLEVPGDSLSLPVRVRRQVERVTLFESTHDGRDVLLFLLSHGVLHQVPLLGIDSAILLEEVPHMAIGGQHLEVLAQVLLDGLGLGGRLDDDDVGHSMPL